MRRAHSMSRERSASHDEIMCSLAALARGCSAGGAGAAGAAPPAPAAAPAPAPAGAKLPFSWCCWCCCCSCSSCLAARRAEGVGKRAPQPGPHGPHAPHDPHDPHNPLLADADAPPALEEIQSWGESFDRLMRSAAGRKVFREFLRGEYSEENIMFWLACEELKREASPRAVEEKARFIYEDYISILSPKEVSLDSRVRELVNRNMVEPTPHTFDEAQLQIYTLMHRDSYPRFLNSAHYKALARRPLPSPAPPLASPPHAPTAPVAALAR